MRLTQHYVPVIAALLLLFGLVPTVTANHTAACSETLQVMRHSGFFLAAGRQGVRANLEGQALDVCTGTDSIHGSFAWVNVQGPGGLASDIIQIGIGKCKDTTGFSQCNEQMNYSWAYGRGSCGWLKFPSVVRLGPWAGVTQNFIVTHVPGFWRGIIAGDTRAEIPQTDICWTPTSVAWFNETMDLGDALGGSAGNKYAVTTMRYQTVQSGAWLAPSTGSGGCNLKPAGAMWGCTYSPPDAYQAWTSR